MGAPLTVAITTSSNGARIGDAPERAQGGLAQAGGDVAARHVRVLAHERVAHRDDGQPVGGEAVRIDPHVDGAVEAADQAHLADAVGALELHLHDLVGQLRQLAQRQVAGHRHREDGRLVIVELRDDRRLGVAGQVLDRGGDLLAHVLGGDVDVAPEVEVEDDDGLARPGDRPQLADALHGVDDLLDLARDLGLHLFGGGARELGAHAHAGDVHGGEAVDAKTRVGRGADHDERQHDHGREHRPADADLGELLHG
jgi:hypothetical protein